MKEKSVNDLVEFEKWFYNKYEESIQVRDWETCDWLMGNKHSLVDSFISGYAQGMKDTEDLKLKTVSINEK